jgi:histidyl-tRNA synthetase
MKVSTQPYKGARDFYPEDKRLQKWMFDKWRNVVEKYGYEEYEAPILERTELFLMKGNEEIVKDQTYTFTDRGDRSVTIRTEMTPSVSRMVAGRRQELAYPARWYSIPNLWRYERMQRGRLREFWQLNVDLFGVSSELAEIEMIQITDDLFQAFGAKRSSYIIKINSRVLVDFVLKDFGLSVNQSTEAVRLIDKVSKMTSDEFREKLLEITSLDVSNKIIEFIKIKNITDIPKKLQTLDTIKILNEVLEKCKSKGIRNIEFDFSLMRGFDYYTDIVFEVFDNNPENKRSMFGGGRYDGLIAEFGVEPVPTVGFGMGDVTFKDFLITNKLIPELGVSTNAVILIKNDQSLEGAQNVARDLRDLGIKTAVDFSGRSFEKQYKMAEKSGIRYAIFVGLKELSEDKFILKDMKSKKEQKHSIERIASIIKDSNK